MKDSTTNTFDTANSNAMLGDGFLIPMTDFVIEYAPKFNPFGTDEQILCLDYIHNYAKFLKQTLKLEMFVPCDENGNVLEEPQMRPERNSFDEEDMDYDAQELYDYIKAKEKVLFEGFKIYDYKLNVFFYLGRKKTLSYDKKRKDFITIGFLPETVEHLINVSSQIKLSQTALNAIFG